MPTPIAVPTPGVIAVPIKAPALTIAPPPIAPIAPIPAVVITPSAKALSFLCFCVTPAPPTNCPAIPLNIKPAMPIPIPCRRIPPIALSNRLRFASSEITFL